MDTAGTTGSPGSATRDGLAWLRLVQPARERLEQNLEAYLKSGQLFYRSVRKIIRDEELLVWYDKELAQLLRLHDVPLSRTNGNVRARSSVYGFKCYWADVKVTSRYPLPTPT